MKSPNSTNQKAIVFDSGTLINFAMNGLFQEFRELKKIFNGKFLITREVKQEIIDRPLTIKRFELEALRLKELLEENVLEMPSAFGIDENKISKMTKDFLDVSNDTFFGRETAIHIIDLGEASCLALSKLLDEKNIKNVISVDERTVRVLSEKPENLLALLQKKLHVGITVKKENFKFFQGYRFIRSAELMYILYKKGIMKLKNHNVLDALLYAVKFKGCSITDEEINEMEKLG
ncbi:Uncharacterised protein [uncultured archaeon]|nr:Uncharacterised protein [uncultured archaeon]